MSGPNDFNAQLARDLDVLAALADRLAKAVRAKGTEGPPAMAARLMISGDKAKVALEKSGGYLLNS
jgi:hypothetical protein